MHYNINTSSICTSMNIRCALLNKEERRGGERGVEDKGKLVRPAVDSNRLMNYIATLIFSQFITITVSLAVSPNQPWSTSWPEG